MEVKIDKTDNEKTEARREISSSIGSVFFQLRWVPLIFQFILAVAISLLTAISVEVKSEILAGLFIGFLFVQILLSSVWIALTPLSFVTRIISSTVATLFFVLCMYRVAWRDGSGHDIAVQTAGPMLVQWLLFQIPLWTLRWRGWKLAIPGQQVRTDRRAEFQFGIKHLLIWMTIIALFFATFKAVVSGIDLKNDGASTHPLEIGLMLTLGNGLIAVPIIWGCLVKHFFWLWILIAILICVAVTFFEIGLYHRGPDSEFFVMINVSQTSLAILAMSAVRLTGYRLECPS